jgi:hypothetical protein
MERRVSEATDHDEMPGPGDSRPRKRRSRRRSWLLLAVALVLVAGAVTGWAVAGHRATPGSAVAGTSPLADTGTVPATAAPPAFPARLTAVVRHDGVQLTWQPASGAHPVTQYLVFRDGTRIGTVHDATTWQDTTAAAGHRYDYQVQSVDSTGIGSALSPKVSVAVPASTSASGADRAAPPPPQAMPASWPSRADTGASGPLTTVTGDVVLSRNGQVYQNMKVLGTLSVTACDVTIRNVEVDTGEPYTGDSTPDLFAIWLQQSATCGVTIDRVSVITDSAPNVYVTTSIRDARGSPVTITNSKLIGAQLGILGMASGTIRGNYVELGPNMRGDHNDAIQGDGASNLVIDHNTLLNPNDQTSALALYTEYGNNTNVTVSGNLMAGGGFACYCGDGVSQNDGSAARAVNVSFVNNVFWRKYFPDAGHFGAGRAYNSAGGGRWVGNVYMNANGTLTQDQVAQPGLDGT